MLPETETNVPTTRNSRQESFLEAEIEKRIVDHVFSYGFANKGKKIFPSQLVSAIGRKFDCSVAEPDL